MPKITREQFQTAIEAGIKNARLHDTDHADRLREIGRTAKETRTNSFGFDQPVTCPAVESGLTAPWRGGFAHAFDNKLYTALGTYHSGVVEVVDD